MSLPLGGIAETPLRYSGDERTFYAETDDINFVDQMMPFKVQAVLSSYKPENYATAVTSEVYQVISYKI